MLHRFLEIGMLDNTDLDYAKLIMMINNDMCIMKTYDFVNLS